MSTADADWVYFSNWSKTQLLEGQGFRRDLDNTLLENLREKWDDIVDKQEYLHAIRIYEERAALTADVRRENDPEVEDDGRIVRRAKDRAIAVALKGSNQTLERLQRVQKKRNRRGRPSTFAAIVRYHDRLMKDAKDEIAESKKASVLRAFDEMSATFPDLPDDARVYVVQAYKELPWEDIDDHDVTDREATAQLKSGFLVAQDYNDLQEVDWSMMASPTEFIQTFRREGRVRCGGHFYYQQDIEEEPFQRWHVSDEWRGYLAAYARIRVRERPVPRWVIQAAKTRAEMMFDHTSVMIYPPDPDHSDLELTLDQILRTEDEYFQSHDTKLYHVRIEDAIAEHLNAMDERPNLLPDRPVRSRPLFDETVKMLDAGRRALQHAWESKLWEMIQTENRPAAEVRATDALYLKALKLFDVDPLVTKKDRQWLSPEYAELLGRS